LTPARKASTIAARIDAADTEVSQPMRDDISFGAATVRERSAAPLPDGRGSERWTAADWRLLAVLLLFAAGLRAWQLAHTEVAARDSIGFIRVAWRLHSQPLRDWPTVLAHSEQHPGYPLAVVAVAQPVRLLVAGPDADRMRLSAQLASALAAVLLVLPVFCLGRELFDRRVGFGAALLLQCLPVSGRILADGLSEAVFLLLAMSALYWSVRGLRSRHAPVAFALAGLFGGLAYLTRPEGAFVVAATAVVLLAGQAVRSWRRPRRDLLVSAAALALPALLLAGPYVATTGRLSVKPGPDKALHHHTAAAAPEYTDGRVLLGAYWVYYGNEQALAVLALEIVKGSFYVGWVAALLGVWWHRRRLRWVPGAWVLLLVCIGVAVSLWRLAVAAHYLSDRHALLILTCGSYWAVAGLIGVGERLAAYWPRLSPCRGLALPLVFAAAALPKTVQPLHEGRSGFREAGRWLAEHSDPADYVADPLCWAHYYAGRVFIEGTDAPGRGSRLFVVLEESDNEHHRVPAYAEARTWVAGREAVYRKAVRRGRHRAEVRVYQIDR
jgi:hypothetical protein